MVFNANFSNISNKDYYYELYNKGIK